MKLEITKRGVYDQKGQPIPVGTEITVKGDTVPGWLGNKGVEVKAKGKSAVTNPANDPVQQTAPSGTAPAKE